VAHKFALIIGNDQYDDPMLSRLVAPGSDISAIASVLRDKEIGGFDYVEELLNSNESAIKKSIAKIAYARQPEDLLLVYFSGHGMLDDEGRLYLAVKETELQYLSATALPATFIDEELKRSYSRRQIIVLDCCHGGAIGVGAKAALGANVDTKSAFSATGFGRVVLTATDATQYAWEGDQIRGEGQNSVFTKHLVNGLTSGAADREPDGVISVDEWFDYASKMVRLQRPKQTPRKFIYDQDGPMMLIARNPRAQLALSTRSQLTETVAHTVTGILLPPPSEEILRDHLILAERVLLEDSVTIFIGDDANVYNRDEKSTWQAGSTFLPSNSELAGFLADQFGYPGSGRMELSAVLDYCADRCTRVLDNIFAATYDATSLHQFVGQLIRMRRRKLQTSLTLVTTNYDDSLERYLETQRQSFHSFGPTHGRGFQYTAPDGARSNADRKAYIRRDGLPIILHLLGGIDRAEPHASVYFSPDTWNFRWNLADQLPAVLRANFSESALVSLGFGSHHNRAEQLLFRSVRENRLVRRGEASFEGWAVLNYPEAQDELFWRRPYLALITLRLSDYISTLAEALAQKTAVDKNLANETNT
jgi:hypothetical protein